RSGLRLRGLFGVWPPAPAAVANGGGGGGRAGGRPPVHRHALNVLRDSPRSLFSFLLRWSPSRTNSTAAATVAGLPVAPSFATAPFIPGICSACFTYSPDASVDDTCI